ncbi:CLUMA_CG003493, isoform A [Clunio marinus]|uniref:CLUMA_CG003493, isoform A n=1 Tax=Clunio marinus TaxID=568069 RepID=A0A1J1HNU5_9DIPT|nr:CLUMA_CG003493, isoform A [Clunio marinus]
MQHASGERERWEEESSWFEFKIIYQGNGMSPTQTKKQQSKARFEMNKIKCSLKKVTQLTNKNEVESFRFLNCFVYSTVTKVKTKTVDFLIHRLLPIYSPFLNEFYAVELKKKEAETIFLFLHKVNLQKTVLKTVRNGENGEGSSPIPNALTAKKIDNDAFTQRMRQEETASKRNKVTSK